VHFIGNADFWISSPITPGTPGLIVSSSASLDAWSGAKAGTIVDPKNDERHHISNSIFIPGIRPPRSAIGSNGTAQDALVLNGAKIQLGSQAASVPVALQTAIVSIVAAFSDPGIAAAIYAVGLSGGSAPSVAALLAAVTAFFVAHSTAGSTKVKAE
jgi:hypothetical protein